MTNNEKIECKCGHKEFHEEGTFICDNCGALVCENCGYYKGGLCCDCVENNRCY